MTDSIFLTRVVLRQYKSIAGCDVRLGPLTCLVGPNGSGKSNFVDALRLVRDSLSGSLDNALSTRGGLPEVSRRSGGRPTHLFGIRLEFILPDHRAGFYAFQVGQLEGSGVGVLNEECRIIAASGGGPFFRIRQGKVEGTSEDTFPTVTGDRLGLVAASGLTAFHPVFDALISMAFYDLDPRVMRDFQRPQDGRLLKPFGENIASVFRELDSESLTVIQEYLRGIVPMVHSVQPKSVGPAETLEFLQEMAGETPPRQFWALNMSDGTLRALGILTALFQGSNGHRATLIGIEEPETGLHPSAFAVLREALQRASAQRQVLVTSHSPDLLDDPELSADTLLSVISEGGETRIAAVDSASRKMLEKRLFTAGELLRLDQIGLDEPPLTQDNSQSDLFDDELCSHSAA